MFDAYFNREPVATDDLKDLILRAVCRDEDDETSEALVGALAKSLRALQEIDGEADTEWEGIESEKEGYQAYCQAYCQELHGRNPKESDFGDLCPPTHTMMIGVPRAAVATAGRADAQRTRALYNYYEENRIGG